MAVVSLTPGTTCKYKGQVVKLNRVLNLQEVLIELPTEQLVRVCIADVCPIDAPSGAECDAYQFVKEADRNIALKRFAIIQPLLGIRIPAHVLTDTVQRHNVSTATLRRWIHAYHQSGLPGLLRQKGKREKKSRLAVRAEQILQECLQKYYYTEQQASVTYTLEQIKLRCALEGIIAPSMPTVHRRIKALGRKLSIQRRLGRQTAREQLGHIRQNTLEANYPLHVVELDHSLLNILLIDEDTGRSLCRPWLTLALDVYSRMVVGFHLGFETPGSCGTGLCLAHALLPKETWLAGHDIDGAWPCWGTMQILYTDNAKEFRGSVLARACEQYGIQLQFRPPRQPNYGGHIERLFKTLKWRIRHLPGAYFKSKNKSKVYRPSKCAIFTLTDFQRWIGTYIVCLYHQRIHSELRQSPLDCYRQGMLGNRDHPGCPIPNRLANELQVKLDFMPYVERTIQRYGVRIGHLEYYDPVLSSYIYGVGETPVNAAGRKYVFRLDPRNVSCVYFLDPNTREYHKIPLADMASGDFSVYTKREALRRVKDKLSTAERVSGNLLLKEIQAIHTQELQVQQRAQGRKASTKKPMTLSQRRHRQEVRAKNDATTPSETPEEAVGVVTNIAVLNKENTIRPFEKIDDGASELFYC
ncbi:Mu transposase C-terminal domain-containing protein [Hymenobacter wooponensis]|uniref:Integrase catalytic domain-containing protein n=1 Tax=Hymenobacter wooponensis TaxID=1525360 RepID=A0A4Z0MG18_9BACT|nr:Mu transposase C-terminal domain-containing protein [Hymenobacter wooponensis]TGD78238.1 hypothetical protein EU557_19185 [Hymenobacter wooponensis]